MYINVHSLTDEAFSYHGLIQSRADGVGPFFVSTSQALNGYAFDLHAGRHLELIDIDCDAHFPPAECVDPTLTVLRESLGDFYRFKDVSPGEPGHEFVRDSFAAMVEFFRTAEPMNDDDAELVSSGLWQLPSLPERYR